MTPSEQDLLELLKRLYWDDGQSRCNQPQVIKAAWSGTVQELNLALRGLTERGYFDARESSTSAYCLSQTGLQAIGARP